MLKQVQAALKTTYAEGYFSNGRDQALQVGGFLKHFAQAGNINKQNEIKDELGVFGKSINQDYTLSGRIGYKRRGTYFYGDNQSGVTPAAYTFDPQKQTFNTDRCRGRTSKKL
jgi:hypothetical protein